MEYCARKATDTGGDFPTGGVALHRLMGNIKEILAAYFIRSEEDVTRAQNAAYNNAD